MNGIWRTGSWLTVVVLMSAWAYPLLGQDEQPKPENPPAAEQAEAETPAVPEDSAVAAILSTKPSTPAECVRAAKILSDLKRHDLAKPLLQKVIDAKLDQQALAELADSFGSTIFVQLSARVDLHPQSSQLADAVLAAQNAALQNPELISGLIKQLQDASAEKRSEAFSGLMLARGAAIAAMVEALADPAREAEHPIIRTALAAMGRQAVDPLSGILEQGDPKLKVQAISIMGELKAPGLQLLLFEPYLSQKNDAQVRAAAGAALKKLSGALPARNQAIRLLIVEAKNYYDGRQTPPGVAQDKAEVWHWDEAQRKCIAATVSADDARRTLATRLARDAFAIAPEDVGVVRLYLATMLEAAAYRKGLSQPLDNDDAAVVEAKKLGVKPLEAAMAYAMQSGHLAAAAAAAGILGQIGNVAELLYQGPKPGPLALAMQYPDRRLRMSAARAIVGLKPQKPFAGSSYLLQTLGFFANSSGSRRVVLAGTNVEDLRRMVPAITAAGLQADTAASGGELLRMVVSSPDYELAMIDAGIDRPPLNILLQQLRHDYRSSDLRVGLIAREGFIAQAEHVAAKDLMARAFPRPHDDVSVTWQLNQLAELKPQEFVGFEERQRQASEALDMLAELGRTSGKLYDIRQVESAALTALNTPALGSKAIALLAMINSPEAQRALVDTASRNVLPLELRQAALTAFRENIQAHGILLTIDAIQKQYQRYNDSKNEDAGTLKILGLILDCLEAPTKKAGS
jgi:hypothetical protein